MGKKLKSVQKRLFKADWVVFVQYIQKQSKMGKNKATTKKKSTNETKRNKPERKSNKYNTNTPPLTPTPYMDSIVPFRIQFLFSLNCFIQKNQYSIKYYLSLNIYQQIRSIHQTKKNKNKNKNKNKKQK